MKFRLVHPLFAPPVPQQAVGVALLTIAAVLEILRGVASLPSPGTLSFTLLAIAALSVFAVSRTRERFTSLIGLFLVTTIVFNLGRPILWLILRDEDVYDLNFGLTLSTPEAIKSQLLLFWCLGIASFIGGYFVFYRPMKLVRPTVGTRAHGYLRRSFWVTIIILILIIPTALITNLTTFLGQGYAGLYIGQTSYTFSLGRVLDFLLPALFGIAVLLGESRYMRLVVFAVGFEVIAQLAVGQRAAFGQWVLVAIWYVCTIQRRRLNRWLLACAAIALVVFFQLVAGWREGYSSTLTLTEFMVEQGVTFLLPVSIALVPPPPVHTIAASVLPLGAIYSAIGIGMSMDRSLGNYLSSYMSISRFEQGYGLGGTFYLELFYAAGGIWVLYAAACAFCGFLLRKWEEFSSRSKLVLLFLSMCVLDIVFLPRGTISAVTSQLVYGSIYLLALYIGHRVALNCTSEVRSGSLLGSERSGSILEAN